MHYSETLELKISDNQLPYFQVFEQRHGFIPELSILDLIFNEGPESLHFLEA
jgi:hypothetical protein